MLSIFFRWRQEGNQSSLWTTAWMAGRFSLLNEFGHGSSWLIEPLLEFWEQNGEEEVLFQKRVRVFHHDFQTRENRWKIWRYIPAKIQVLICNIDASNLCSFYNPTFNFCNSTFHIYNSTSILTIQRAPFTCDFLKLCMMYNATFVSFNSMLILGVRYACITIQHSCFDIELHKLLALKKTMFLIQESTFIIWSLNSERSVHFSKSNQRFFEIFSFQQTAAFLVHITICASLFVIRIEYPAIVVNTRYTLIMT